MFLKLRILAVKKGKSFFRRRGCDWLMLEKITCVMHEYKRIHQRVREGRENCPLEIFENISICPVLGKCEPRKLPTFPKNSLSLI